MTKLETPDDPESIYLARTDDVNEHRPTFTGDVYRLEDSRLLMVLQHPCALRSGVDLNPKLLMAVAGPDRLRSDWANVSYKKMPLPLLADSTDHSAHFADLDLVDSTVLPASERIAVMSQRGVNLLMQRWVYHNTRVLIPTLTYSDSTVGPFDEADLIEEWVGERVELGAEPQAAERECATWLDVKVGERDRRTLLSDSQHASTIRREARAYRKETA